MPATLDSERLLSMSAFEAAFVLRQFRQLNPSYDDDQLVESIRNVRADFYPNDYEAGLVIERGIPSHFGRSDEEFFKAAIEAVILIYEPVWMRLAPGGRDHVLRAVSTNGS